MWGILWYFRLGMAKLRQDFLNISWEREFYPSFTVIIHLRVIPPKLVTHQSIFITYHCDIIFSSLSTCRLSVYLKPKSSTIKVQLIGFHMCFQYPGVCVASMYSCFSVLPLTGHLLICPLLGYRTSLFLSQNEAIRRLQCTILNYVF